MLKFIECSDKDVQNSLSKINLEGIRVSNLINRWVVDVPFWKENYYRDQLSKINIIEKIYPNINQNRYSRDIENYEEVDENEK